ncbi:hypothetical protein BJX68DRAFT_228197 [Aspergillus pseudodeflectus]|uniref:Uncharacterized protein n=1 Tax=Aspergillus pseudodeflectus TaxID=176178 RepID=A0ABR4L431_9EURO
MSGLLNDLISRSWTNLPTRLLMILTTGGGGWVGVCHTFQNRDRRGFLLIAQSSPEFLPKWQQPLQREPSGGDDGTCGSAPGP